MQGRFSGRKLRPLRPWAMPLLTLVLMLAACQAKEPPLSPAAAAFKKEVKDCLVRLSTPLVAPVVQSNQAAINEALKHAEPEAIKLCRMCPFRMGVLDREGDTLTVYPFKEEAMGNFSTYDVVVQTLKNRKINQQRFYLQDGSQMYIICAPLKQGEELAGILALSLSAAEAKNRWGLTAQEFLRIDFNQ